MGKEQVLQRIKELSELKKWVEGDKELKKNTVLIQIPYGLPNDNFLVSALISKESFQQI